MKLSPLTDRELLRAIEEMVRRRVPASEVDDVVQSVLADAVASNDAPTEPEALRRWISGVVRHKIADFYRRGRAQGVALDDAPEPAEHPSHEARDLLRWATRELPPSPDAEKTLEWMMHEAEGEKLEAIAERERMPPERVRQRVSRLRAFFRERWRREIALVAAAVTLLVLGWMLSRQPDPAPPIADPHRVLPDPESSPRMRAERLRSVAEGACAKREWRACIEGLDEAKRLDPAGETDAQARAREEAKRALDPAPIPSASPTPDPVPTGVPKAPGPRSTVAPPSSAAPPPPSKKPTKPAPNSFDNFGSVGTSGISGP